MVYGIHNELVTGAYKPTNITGGGPHLRSKELLCTRCQKGSGGGGPSSSRARGAKDRCLGQGVGRGRGVGTLNGVGKINQ